MGTIRLAFPEVDDGVDDRGVRRPRCSAIGELDSLAYKSLSCWMFSFKTKWEQVSHQHVDLSRKEQLYL